MEKVFHMVRFFSKANFIKIILFLGVLNSQLANAEEFLVKYKSSIGVQALANNNIMIMDHNSIAQLYKVDIPSDKKIETLIGLLTNAQIEYAVPNFKLSAFIVPNSLRPISDEALKEQWSLAKIEAEKAWTKAGNKGSKGITVAVIDTGVDYNHKNLAANMVKGYNFIQNNEDPMDITGQNPGHGTHCAGIVGSTGKLDGGTSGMAADVSIMPLRFLDQNGSGDLNNGIKAIDYAIQKKVDVISASWGAAVSYSQAKPLVEAIQRAEKAGIIFIVAASNDGKNNDTFEVYPANAMLSNTISVAASNSSDGKPSWSNYGRVKVNIASPGDTIISTLPKDKWGNLSGTSMATPLVAGLVAFLKAQDNSLSPMQIRSLLQSTGDKVSILTQCDCRVNASNAVDALMNKKMFLSPYAATYAKGDKIHFDAVFGNAPFKFISSNTAVATIDNNGDMTAVSDGETQISVEDSSGNKASSYKIFVGKSNGQQPPGNDPGMPDPGQPGEPGQPGDCPFGDQSICDAICQIKPDMPFCQHN